MMKFIKIVAELFLPLLFIFGILPIMFRTFKSVFVGEDKPKKKYNPRMLSHGNLHGYRNIINGTPPPPPSRRIGDYELKGGRLVKKDQKSYDDKRSTPNLDEWEVIDGQIRRRKVKKQHEQTQRDMDRVYGDIKRDKGVINNPKVETLTKKKHFNKGVDPDFL